MPNVGYQEIAERLRERVESGELTGGAPVPSEAQLCAEWGVSRTTIRRALGVLEDANLVEAVPGRGRFVRTATGESDRQPDARFEQVAASLKDEISKMSAGDRLDREVQLAERFRVAQGTMRRALLLLAPFSAHVDL